MTMAYAQYINYAAKELENYINHLVDVNNEYNKTLKDVYGNFPPGEIQKPDKMLQQEKELREAYDNATSLYNDLRRIADKYKNGMNIDTAIKSFSNQLSRTYLPIYEKIIIEEVPTITLSPVETSEAGVITGGAANISNNNKNNIKDEEFNIPLSLKNIGYYKKEVNNKLETEVGNKLRSMNIDNDDWSNDLRHQYASAVYARNLGEKMAKILGDLNEFFDANQSGRDDKARDQINNEIGRQYGLEFPYISRSKLLDILVNDYNHNLKIIKSKLKEKGF